MKKIKLIILVLLSVSLLSACFSLLTNAQKVTIHCDSKSQAYEIIQCYKDENAKWITRRINHAVRGLTTGDWPFEYQILYVAHLSSNGKLKDMEELEESGSHKLNKAVYKALEDIDAFYVPHNTLFVQGGFENLKILIKPARTPILGDEIANDKGAIVIYLVESCSSRSERC